MLSAVFKFYPIETQFYLFPFVDSPFFLQIPLGAQGKLDKRKTERRNNQLKSGVKENSSLINQTSATYWLLLAVHSRSASNNDGVIPLGSIIVPNENKSSIIKCKVIHRIA